MKRKIEQFILCTCSEKLSIIECEIKLCKRKTYNNLILKREASTLTVWARLFSTTISHQSRDNLFLENYQNKNIKNFFLATKFTMILRIESFSVQRLLKTRCAIFFRHFIELWTLAEGGAFATNTLLLYLKRVTINSAI